MDVGCYAKGLQYATNARIEIIGKPSKSFFYQAIQSMNLTKDEVSFYIFVYGSTLQNIINHGSHFLYFFLSFF